MEKNVHAYSILLTINMQNVYMKEIELTRMLCIACNLRDKLCMQNIFFFILTFRK